MKVLDKFIEENGFRGSQSVKVGYDSLKEFINQRVIEELHNLYNEEEEHNDCISKELIYQRLKELKQE